MFEQLQPVWGSQLSLRAAILNAIGCGFVAGLDFGVAILKLSRFHTDILDAGMFLVLLVLSLALATRFYFVAMSKAGVQASPTRD